MPEALKVSSRIYPASAYCSLFSHLSGESAKAERASTCGLHQSGQPEGYREFRGFNVKSVKPD